MSTPQLADFIKAYDVRGLYPEQLNETVSAALGAAFAQVVVLPEGAKSMVVGHDMRESSPLLSEAFAAGAADQGVDVTMIGLTSTDGLYFASGSMDLAGAMFTASHNPAAYNGIKLCRPGARPVSLDTGLAEVRDLAQWLLERGSMHSLPTSGDKGTLRHTDVMGDYAAHLHSLVDLRGGRPLRVVVDAGNGMAGHTVPHVLGEDLPVEVIPLYFELDGTFPNHEANPLDPANVVDLQKAVLEHSADAGLAFDGDADRCFVIDERGEVVSASTITALVADREIARAVAAGTPASEVAVVHNLISSRSVPETILTAGARPVRTRVGHSYIKAEMAQHNAIFGGEHSGHYYFRDFWFADTGMLAGMHVLAALAASSEPLSALLARYDKYEASGEINSGVADVSETLARVTDWAAEAGLEGENFDGLIVDSAPGATVWWASVRPSNTEPFVRLNVEAADTATMEQVRDEILQVIRMGTVSS
ncbi:phosphomannomutase/phosphoglucomutase [Ornithinimicrobium sp. Arc0846-15]|nr:phosphomannomutase/phosphoglucomutase [Ornithinimicrobium laminariae]